jgi:hypothetical protein
MRASDWRPHTSNTLRGFSNLQFPSGLVVNDCTLHEKGIKRWVLLPGKPQLDSDGRERRDPATCKALYVSVVQIPSHEAWHSFQRQALAAVDRMLGR